MEFLWRLHVHLNLTPVSASLSIVISVEKTGAGRLVFTVLGGEMMALVFDLFMNDIG